MVAAGSYREVLLFHRREVSLDENRQRVEAWVPWLQRRGSVSEIVPRVRVVPEIQAQQITEFDVRVRVDSRTSIIAEEMRLRVVGGARDGLLLHINGILSDDLGVEFVLKCVAASNGEPVSES